MKTEWDALKDRADTAERAAAENAALVSRLQRALSFAASVIKSGESWTTTCDDMISGALSQSPAAALAEVRAAAWDAALTKAVEAVEGETVGGDYGVGSLDGSSVEGLRARLLALKKGPTP